MYRTEPLFHIFLRRCFAEFPRLRDARNEGARESTWPIQAGHWWSPGPLYCKFKF